MKQRNYTKAIVTSGLLIGISIILRSTGIMVPIAGAQAMRISFDSIFFILPGILFGPMLGGLAAGITDILAYILKPTGLFIPLMTVTTMLASFLPALIWLKVKKISAKNLQVGYIIFFIVIGIIGIINHLALKLSPKSSLAVYLSTIGKKAQFIGIGLEVTAVLGLALLFFSFGIKKNIQGKKIYENYLRMITAIALPKILVNILNTYLLRIYIPQLAGKAFMIIFIPRIAEALLLIPIEAYILSVLYVTYKSINREPSTIFTN